MPITYSLESCYDLILETFRPASMPGCDHPRFQALLEKYE